MTHNPLSLFLVTFMLLAFSQCTPESSNYSFQTFEGNLTIITDSTTTNTFHTINIYRSNNYSNYLSFNNLNLEYISNGNRIIINDVPINDENGFIHIEGILKTENDSLNVDLLKSQHTTDSILYFRTHYFGILSRKL